MYRAVRRLIFGSALVALPLSLTAATADASTGGLRVSSHVAAAVTPSDAATPYVPPVGTPDDPPYYSIVAGNCPAVSGLESSGSSGTWTPVHDTDYGGSVFYNSSYDQLCDGDKIAYAPTSSSQTAQFRWHFHVYPTSSSRCYFYAYIPYHDATDIKARYDFWYQKSSGGPVIWSAWPGTTINQLPLMNWNYIGTAYVPIGYDEVTVTLSNTGPADQKAGVGSVASVCY